MQLCWMEVPWARHRRHRHSVGRWRHGYTGNTETLGDMETGDRGHGETRRHGDSGHGGTRRHGDSQVREREDTAGGYHQSWCTLASCLPDLSR